VLLLFVLTVGGLWLYLHNMDFNAYKPLLKQSVFEATGRDLNIDGIVALKLSLHPSLIVEGLHLSNISGGSRANMMNIKRMEVQLSLMPLLYGELAVDRIVLVKPDILLERLPSGHDNWSFKAMSNSVDESSGLNAEQSNALLLPHIQRLLIRDARVIYRDSNAKHDISLQLAALEMGQLPNESRLSLQGRGTVNRHDLTFSGIIDDLPRLLANQSIQLLDFKTSLVGLHASFSGSIAHPMDAQGMVLNVLLETDSIMQAAEAADSPLPRDFPLHMQLTIKDTTHGFQFSELQAKLADSVLSGQFSLDIMGKRPAIDGALSSTSFDVTRLLALKKDATTADRKKTTDSKNQRLFSSQTINFSALKIVDVQLRLKVKSLILPEFELTELDTQIQLKNGVLALKPFSMRMAEGEMAGYIRLDSLSSPVQFTSNIQLSNFHPSALLSVEKGQEALIKDVPINANMKFSGKGQSVAEIMAHANGVLLVKMGKGYIKSNALRLIGGDVLMNLMNTLNPFSEKMNYNALQCGIVHFRIKNGEMRTRNGIAFETDRMHIISSGHINLGSENIDLSISTETREGLGLNITNMVNVVKVGGTLAKPGIRVDAGKTGLVAARTVGAFATGGLSLLGESLFKRVTADSTPCQTALHMSNER